MKIHDFNLMNSVQWSSECFWWPYLSYFDVGVELFNVFCSLRPLSRLFKISATENPRPWLKFVNIGVVEYQIGKWFAKKNLPCNFGKVFIVYLLNFYLDFKATIKKF